MRRAGLLAVGGILLALACAASDRRAAPDWETRRSTMVETQIRQRGVTDEAVLAAMRRVPRHLFVPEPLRHRAHEDNPLPIGAGQTISQPFIVAYMTELLRPAPSDRVLEIGTGSGYQAAVLAELVREVYTIEIVEELARRADALLETLGYANIHRRTGDGYQGWPEVAPFDKIMLAAAPPAIPSALVEQLAPGGLLVAPVGAPGGMQMMTVVEKTNEGVVTRETLPVRFVPMVEGR